MARVDNLGLGACGMTVAGDGVITGPAGVLLSKYIKLLRIKARVGIEIDDAFG